jgi:predicted signal transduction protein with EAL and GGDEF domain
VHKSGIPQTYPARDFGVHAREVAPLRQEHAATSEELLEIADKCLYESKASGRDAVTAPRPTEGTKEHAAAKL